MKTNLTLPSPAKFFRLAIIATVLATLCVPLFSPLVLAASFSDVSENTVDYRAIEYLKQKGIIKGYEDGTFKPEQTINRAEALKIVMLATASGSSATQVSTQQESSKALAQTTMATTSVTSYPDVSESDWFYQYVKDASAAQIVSGYDNGQFKPAANINVAESLKIIELAFKAQVTSNVIENPYPDVDKTAWYAPYALYGKTKQVIWTLDDGKLHAGRDITRGEFAQIIYRLLYIAENKLDTFPLNTDWPTYTDSAGNYAVKYPYDWQKIAAGTQTILWKQDLGNNQISFARVYPNSATAVIAADPNPQGLSLENYLARIEYDSSAIINKMTLNNYPFASVTLPGEGIADYYFEFPNKQILVLYSQLGSGLNRSQLSSQVSAIVGSIRYTESTGVSTPTVTAEEKFMSEVRKNILVLNKGEETMDLFSDLVLIETDSIGIGTGPVDYYYSAVHNVTLKYERTSNLILAIQEDKTTGF